MSPSRRSASLDKSTLAFHLRRALRNAIIPLLFCAVGLWLARSGVAWRDPWKFLSGNAAPQAAKSDDHPIDRLRSDAEARFNRAIDARTTDLASAEKAYAAKRNQQPPPHFGDWYQLAMQAGALVVEDFWDPIYEDLAPFMRMSAKEVQDATRVALRDGTAAGVETFWYRQGQLGTSCDDMDACLVFSRMLREVVQEAPWLPDMEIPFNPFVAPKLVRDPGLQPDEGVGSTLDPVVAVRGTDEGDTKSQTVWKSVKNMPALVRAACPAGSPTSETPLQERASNFTVHGKYARNLLPQGFLVDFEASKDPCTQPDLLHLHGSLVAPSFDTVTTHLFPLFSVQKLGNVNPEIRIPSTLYWSEDKVYFSRPSDAADEDWSSKLDRVTWLGSNTGGRVVEENWRSFQRHRFVSMTNISNIYRVEESGRCDLPWAMSDVMCHFLWKRGDRHALSRFVRKYLEVGFYAFGVWPSTVCSSDTGHADDCRYLNDAYTAVPMKSLDDVQRSRYLVDIDGNGYSARFRSFLMSTSLPIKATMYSEWHDSRIFPWKHFVPMDNRFSDFWGILDYFIPGCLSDEGPAYSQKIKYRDCDGHDHVARLMGRDGAEWARKVLRKEDMKIYLLRLLMEYGRVWNGIAVDAANERQGNAAGHSGHEEL